MKHPQRSLASDGTQSASDRLPPRVTYALPLAYLVTEFPYGKSHRQHISEELARNTAWLENEQHITKDTSTQGKSLSAGGGGGAERVGIAASSQGGLWTEAQFSILTIPKQLEKKEPPEIRPNPIMTYNFVRGHSSTTPKVVCRSVPIWSMPKHRNQE